MHIANKRRFIGFVAAVALVAVACVAMVYFLWPISLRGQVAAVIDLEQVQSIELTARESLEHSTSITLTDPTDIRGCLMALDGVSVRRALRAGSIRQVVPGQTFHLRMTDALGNQALLDIAGGDVVFNLNTAYTLHEPGDLSAFQSILESTSGRAA